MRHELAIAGDAVSDVVIAFDVGLRRIGIASGNLLTRTASPLTSVQGADGIDWPRIDALIAEWAPRQIVVGRPQAETETKIVGAINLFVQELSKRYKLPVATVDEALTSAAARSALAEQRRTGQASRRLRKGDIDMYAACLIAEQWMDDKNNDG